MVWPPVLDLVQQRHTKPQKETKPEIGMGTSGQYRDGGDVLGAATSSQEGVERSRERTLKW